MLRLALLFCVLAATTLRGSAPEDPRETHGRFTGEVLPVLYVTDVLRSVEFYCGALGFELHHYFDYESGEQVREWTQEAKPVWAEVAVGDFAFGIHKIADGEELVVGGSRHYVLVEDVKAHRARVSSHGVAVGPLRLKSWMHMFKVTDPDGHEIHFGERPSSASR